MTEPKDIISMLATEISVAENEGMGNFGVSDVTVFRDQMLLRYGTEVFVVSVHRASANEAEKIKQGAVYDAECMESAQRARSEQLQREYLEWKAAEDADPAVIARRAKAAARGEKSLFEYMSTGVKEFDKVSEGVALFGKPDSYKRY